MSRVYDALQQFVPDQACSSDLHEGRADALFPEQFAELVWDPYAAAVVQSSLSSLDRVPALSSPYGFASEQFRLLATRLQQLQLSRPLKSVLLTSSVEGEGKTLLTLNLALSLAQAGQKVIVIDGELRRPGLSLMLKVEKQAGLREWYRSNRPPVEFMCRLANSKLWVLPCGQVLVDPLELLKSPRIPDLHVALNATFDWVLVDCPPLIPLADAEILSRILDGTIIVVRRDKSPKTELKQALERVAPAKIVGFVLNDFPTVNTYGYGNGLPTDNSAAQQ